MFATLQFDGEFITMVKDHKKDWDEVEREQVADYVKGLRKAAATNPLSKTLLKFVEAGAVIPTLDGRHR